MARLSRRPTFTVASVAPSESPDPPASAPFPVLALASPSPRPPDRAEPPWTAAASALTAGGPAASDDRLLHASLLPLLSPGQRAPPTPIMLLDASPNHPARAPHARPCSRPPHTQSHASSSGHPVLPAAGGPLCLCRPLALCPASNSDASVAPFPPLPRLLSVDPLLLPSCAAAGGVRRAPSQPPPARAESSHCAPPKAGLDPVRPNQSTQHATTEEPELLPWTPAAARYERRPSPSSVFPLTELLFFLDHNPMKPGRKPITISAQYS